MENVVCLLTNSETQSEIQTIGNQIMYVRRYCELNGINAPEVYEDDGVS